MREGAHAYEAWRKASAHVIMAIVSLLSASNLCRSSARTRLAVLPFLDHRAPPAVPGEMKPDRRMRRLHSAFLRRRPLPAIAISARRLHGKRHSTRRWRRAGAHREKLARAPRGGR